MAEAPKTEAAPAKTGFLTTFIEALRAVLILVFVFLLFVFLVGSSNSALPFLKFLFLIQIFAFLVFLVFAGTTIHMMRTYGTVIDSIGAIYEAKYKPIKKDTQVTTPYTKRLELAKIHAYSNHPAELRLSILELDNLLKEALVQKGYTGDTVAELLQSAKDRKFGSLENAWDAHKVRNRIAHEGTLFELTEAEAQRVYKLYMTVFDEFGIS